MKTKILVLLAATLLIGLSLTSCGESNKNKKLKAKVEELVDNENYIEAYKVAKKIEEGRDYTVKSIAKAQIASLIQNEDFALAAEIATEKIDYGYYFTIILNRLPFLYTKNKQNAFVVLATLRFPPAESNLNNDIYWNCEEVRYWDVNQKFANRIILQYNNSISQAMNLAKNTGDTKSLKQLSEFLKPLYGKCKVEQYKSVYGEHGYEGKEVLKDKNGKPIMEEVDERTPTDYSDANRIKKEYGLK